MTTAFLTCFLYALCYFYAYQKLLRLSVSRRQGTLLVLLATAAAVLLCILAQSAAAFVAPLSMPLLFFCTKWVHRTPTLRSLSASALAFVATFAAFTLATLLVNTPLSLLGFAAAPKGIAAALLCAGVGLLQLLAVFLAFRWHKLKNGLPFLFSPETEDVGAHLSLTTFALVVLFRLQESVSIVILIPAFCLFLFCVLLMFWQRSRAKQKLLFQDRQRELTDLQQELAACQQTRDALTESNRTLAQIVHRDNKLIPAMEYAVTDYLRNSAPPENTALAQTGAALAKEAERLGKNRAGILRQYETAVKQLPPTGFPAIDNLLAYMAQKGAQMGIALDVSLLCADLSPLAAAFAQETQWETLLADLLENAIIATQHSEHKQILLLMGLSDTYYRIQVLDTGVAFSLETLAALGLRQHTTHADEGGSGIGMMSLFEIARVAQASVIIDETLPHSQFTKSICVQFDANTQYCVHTPRAGALLAQSSRTDWHVQASAPQA